MTASRTLLCALALAAGVLLALAGLAMRYGPCPGPAGVCLASAVDGTCRLLTLAGLHQRLDVVGSAALAALLPPPVLALACAARQVWRTRALSIAIRCGRAPILPPTLATLAQQLGLERDLDLVVATQPFAFTYGLLAPRICLSTAVLERVSPDQLAAVLLHEQAHARGRDPLRALVTRSLAQGVFFLPALRDLDEHLRLRQEVEADTHAVGRVGARAVAGALYKLLGGTVPAALRGAAASSIAAPRRLDHLLGREGSERLMLSPAHLWPSVGLGMVMLCLLVL